MTNFAKVKLVVDGTCDLPADWLAKWDIAVLYPFVNFDDESFLDDGIALPKAEFYRRLSAGKGLPKTSAFSPGLAQKAIQQQLAKAEHVVVFSLASAFSSIYNTLRLAAENVDTHRVTVVDTGTVSMAYGWMVVAAAEAMQKGAGKDEVIAAARSTGSRAKLYAAVDTLEFLRRGGRVNTLVASIGTMLQIKPLIEVKNGVVSTVSRVRTMNKAVQGLVDLAMAQAPLERLAILHAHNADGANDLKEKLASITPPETVILDIGTAIGTHVGPGAVGIATVRKE
jgi:DegV family protein with EDD domain